MLFVPPANALTDFCSPVHGVFFSVWKVCSYFSRGVAKKLLKSKFALIYPEQSQTTCSSFRNKWMGIGYYATCTKMAGAEKRVWWLNIHYISAWKPIMIPSSNSFFLFFFPCILFLLCSIRATAEMENIFLYYCGRVLILKSIDFIQMRSKHSTCN